MPPDRRQRVAQVVSRRFHKCPLRLFRLAAFGDLDRHPRHTGWSPSVVVEDAAARSNPMDAPIWPRHAVLSLVPAARLKGTSDRRLHGGPVVRVNHGNERFVG